MIREVWTLCFACIEKGVSGVEVLEYVCKYDHQWVGHCACIGKGGVGVRLLCAIFFDRYKYSDMGVGV